MCTVQNNEDKLAASFCFQVVSWVPDILCNFYVVKKHKTSGNSKTTKAREKKEHIFGILRILDLFYVYLTNFKNNQILHNKISLRFLMKTKLYTGWQILICEVSVRYAMH
jgi:hypothetical protein